MTEHKSFDPAENRSFVDASERTPMAASREPSRKFPRTPCEQIKARKERRGDNELR